MHTQRSRLPPIFPTISRFHRSSSQGFIKKGKPCMYTCMQVHGEVFTLTDAKNRTNKDRVCQKRRIIGVFCTSRHGVQIHSLATRAFPIIAAAEVEVPPRMHSEGETLRQLAPNGNFVEMISDKDDWGKKHPPFPRVP